MKACLHYPDHSPDWRPALEAAAERHFTRTGAFHRRDAARAPSPLPWNAGELTADLGLGLLFEAMASGDDWIFEVARHVILGAVKTELPVIQYRQAMLRDCLKNPGAVRDLYAVAIEGMHSQRSDGFASIFSIMGWLFSTAVTR